MKIALTIHVSIVETAVARATYDQV
jgi:hypothetical protein